MNIQNRIAFLVWQHFSLICWLKARDSVLMLFFFVRMEYQYLCYNQLFINTKDEVSMIFRTVDHWEEEVWQMWQSVYDEAF